MISFDNPYALLLAIALPIIVLLHLRKKQTLEYAVPSLSFWEEILREKEGIGKLKIQKYIILALQLAAAAFIVLAASKLSYAHNAQGKITTIALDCSISMQANESGSTHFQMAKKEAEKYIEALDNDAVINVLLLKDSCEEAARKAKKSEALAAIKNAEITNESLNAEASSRSINTYEGRKLFFSNNALPIGDQWIKAGTGFENIGLTSARFDYFSKNIICSLRNYCKSGKDITLEVKADNGIRNLKAVHIEPQGDIWVNMRMPQKTEFFTISIKEADMLEADNSFTLPVGDESKKKVLFKGESIFLEKALLCIPDIMLYKANDSGGDDMKYDACIISDPSEASAFKGKCGLWLMSPPMGLKTGEGRSSAPLEAGEGELSKDLSFKEAFCKYKFQMKVPEGFQSLIHSNGKPVMLYGTEKGSRIVYSAVDFDRSNMIMHPDFPILVSNTVHWLAQNDREKLANNPPPELVTGAVEKKAAERKPEPGVHSFAFILLMGALLMMAAEWEVYRLGI